MIVKLLTEHNLEFLSLKEGCRCWSESTHVKMSNCWKSHALAHYYSLTADYRPFFTLNGSTKRVNGLAREMVNLDEISINLTSFQFKFYNMNSRYWSILTSDGSKIGRVYAVARERLLKL